MNKQDIAEIAELLVKAYEKNLYGERKDSFDAMAESVVEKIESLEKENAELKEKLKELKREYQTTVQAAGWKNVKGWRRKGNE